MNRSTNIVGRVLRNLKLNGISTSEITDEEIYDELNQGQNLIISEINFSKSITIKLETGKEYYDLSTDNNPIERLNVISVRAVKIPESFRYNFKILPVKEFIDKINSTTITTGQPVIGTIYDNKLRIFPVPTSEYNNAELELIVYLNSSTRKIDKNNEPELPEMFDKALELFATSQFLTSNLRIELLNEFTQEVRRLRPLIHRTNFNLQRPSIL